MTEESHGRIVHVFGTPYHPWSQGVVERVGKTLKTLIRLFKVQSETPDWKGKERLTLNNLVANYNDAVHSSTNLKPSYFHPLSAELWTEETRQLVETVKSRMYIKAGKKPWTNDEIVGRVGDLARIMLDDCESQP